MLVRPLRHDKRCGWFSKSRGLSASVSFLSSPPPPRLLAPFFARPLLRKSAETLASQARHKKTKLNICDHMLTSSTQLQNRSFHVVERTRTSLKCQKMRNARAKRAKKLFFNVKYANLWGFCCRRRRGSLSSLLTK